MADSILDPQDISYSLVQALEKLSLVDKLQIEAMCRDLVKLMNWTYGEAMHFLFKTGVMALEEE